MLADLPEAKWIAWEPAGRENVFAGTKLAFGEELQPSTAFDKADVVLSLEADFLGAGPVDAARTCATSSRGEARRFR